MGANRTTSGYQLQGELARLSLPGAGRDPGRKLAWTNSICALFLLIGLVGSRPAANFVEPPPQVEETVPTIIEPLKPPAPEVQKVQPSASSQESAPPVVAVTIDTPAINFAVPTIGNLVVPAALAQAPAAKIVLAQPVTFRVTSTGKNGERPYPPYPSIALSAGEQGSVTVSILVDEFGVATQVSLKESSGYPILDRGTLEFIKRRWHIMPLNGSRNFETIITYRISAN